MTHIEISNRKGKLSLNDGVHKDSADKLIEELGRLYGPAAVAAQMRIGEVVCSADDALEAVEVTINSPGGSVMEGTRIYNALRQMSARGVEVTTTVDGLAASMGSVILMAGDIRQMTKGSRVMIHEASTMAWGDARTMKRNAELLESISAEIAGIYSERTGGDATAIRSLMFDETWMDSAKAQELGFVHAVIDYDKKEDAENAAGFDMKPKGMTGILSKLFPGNDEVAKLEAAIADADSLRNDLATAQARIDELAPLAEVNAKLQADLSDLTAKLAEADKLANEHTETITALKAEVEAVNEKAAIKAAELLAQQGHPAPVKLVEEGSESKSILEQFEALKGNEATEFYRKHRKAILAAQSKL